MDGGTGEVPLCDPYFYEDPRYLFRSSWIDRYLNRRHGVCASELVNEIVFVYIFSIICGAIAGVAVGLDSAPIIAGMAASLYLIPTFLQLRNVDGFRQSVSSATSAVDASGSYTKAEGFDPQPLPESIKISKANPFDNVLISDYTFTPKRRAASHKTTSELDEMFRVNWYNDQTDVFGKTQSQRMFITQPSTTIPNDQESYQNWLYKIPGKTCKEGNPDACYSGTEGAPMPWLNSAYS